MKNLIEKLQGPILVLGASGFVGANLFRSLLSHRNDVYGTTTQEGPWRLEGLPDPSVIVTDLLVESNLMALLDTVKPRTIFDCIAYGAYSFEQDSALIYKTNMLLTANLLKEIEKRKPITYIHAGSSSEYGDQAEAPKEDTQLTPNSHYSVSKSAASGLIYFYGKKLGVPCANLRLYSVYGPYEDSSRLIPNVISKGVKHILPSFVDPNISRDFVYIDDVSEAFIKCALNLSQANYGESFNIGSGIKTTIAELAELSRSIFDISAAAQFDMPKRDWDTVNWYADPSKAREILDWRARVPVRQGLIKMLEWYQSIDVQEKYLNSSKRYGVDHIFSVSAIIACYKDNQAIPIIYQRLKAVFEKLNIDYEIIFVNDNSPDDSEEVIRNLSSLNRRVIGISHARNFGSQSAFRSGMEIASKNACVLLDGDLQDPPELIEEFVQKWREGYDVVYGRRVKRDAPWHMQIAYKLFYRVFDRFSYIQIPHDAGDFSLMDKRVVRSLLRFPERDLFIRGIRAFAGFKQTGVDYVRPERMFGVSTNNFFKNLGWAKKGILSFSNTPLNMLTAVGVVLLALSIILMLTQLTVRILFPDLAPRGATTTLLAIIFFGGVNIFAVSLVGEYIAKIFEEVKARPHFIRRSIIKDGELRPAAEAGEFIQTERQGR
ncbi:MAG: NAD-dependent epimerase/dehydratase family protein [Candidatus Methylumidiphilus sp.]